MKMILPLKYSVMAFQVPVNSLPFCFDFKFIFYFTNQKNGNISCSILSQSDFSCWFPQRIDHMSWLFAMWPVTWFTTWFTTWSYDSSHDSLVDYTILHMIHYMIAWLFAWFIVWSHYSSYHCLIYCLELSPWPCLAKVQLTCWRKKARESISVLMVLNYLQLEH